MRQTSRRIFAVLLAVSPLAVAQVVTTAPTTEPSALATQPATLPTTQALLPTTAPTTRPRFLPGDFAILDTRSIFLKGHVSPATAAPAGNASPSAVTSNSPESSIVFSGVTASDGVLAAMFEDTTAGKIVLCKAGDAIARGKLTQITLDAVTYETPGRTTRVQVGQTLDAGEAPAVASRASITIDSSGNPTTAPSSSNDVLERLRAKRRQEIR